MRACCSHLLHTSLLGKQGVHNSANFEIRTTPAAHKSRTTPAAHNRMRTESESVPELLSECGGHADHDELHHIVMAAITWLRPQQSALY